MLDLKKKKKHQRGMCVLQTVQRWLGWKNKELTHPECVDSAHQLLVGCRNFIINVLVKAWFYYQELRQWGKIVDTIWNRKSTLNTRKFIPKKKMCKCQYTWLHFYWPTCHFEFLDRSWIKKKKKNRNVMNTRKLTLPNFGARMLTFNNVRIAELLKFKSLKSAPLPLPKL